MSERFEIVTGALACAAAFLWLRPGGPALRPASLRIRATGSRMRSPALAGIEQPGEAASRRVSGGRRIGAALARRIGSSYRRGSTARRSRMAAIEIVTGMAAELRAGRPARDALICAVGSAPVRMCEQAVGAARLGGDVPGGLRSDVASGAPASLLGLAALWQVAEGSGAGLAAGAERLGAAALAREQVRRELASHLAGPKATARVLAALPVVGCLLGLGLGANPVAWLLGSPLGWIVLMAGTGLEVLGLWWVSRLARSVEQQL